MSDTELEIDMKAWVELVRDDPFEYRQRQIVEVTLHAIAMTEPLRDSFYLKGGTLMGLAYHSRRQTADIDFTTVLDPSGTTVAEIREHLDAALPRAATLLERSDLVVKTNSVMLRPRSTNFETASFPAIKLKIGYAERGTNQEKQLNSGNAANILGVDISFNEKTYTIQELKFTDGGVLLAYNLIDIIAEKYRALLQQVRRHRNRRQDIYDIYLLINNEVIDDSDCSRLLEVLLKKCRSRDMEPDAASFDDPEIKKRSGDDWDTMQLEAGELPDFEKCFAQVHAFYKSLPWDTHA